MVRNIEKALRSGAILRGGSYSMGRFFLLERLDGTCEGDVDPWRALVLLDLSMGGATRRDEDEQANITGSESSIQSPLYWHLIGGSALVTFEHGQFIAYDDKKRNLANRFAGTSVEEALAQIKVLSLEERLKRARGAE